MTRHSRFDVRVAPGVLAFIERSRDVARQARFFDAVDRLARYGTRANGARKLHALDMWEIRFGDTRAFFVLVPGKRVVAVGAVVRKKTRRLSMSRLRTIERQVDDWRREQEDPR